MSTTLSGWKTVAKYLGPDVSPMRVRRAVDRRELKATKGPNGYTFAVSDLDEFRETLGLAARGSDNAGDVTPEPSTSDVASTADPSSMSAVTASWLLHAAAGRNDDVSDNGDAVDVVESEPEGRQPAGAPTQPPLGATRASGFPFNAVAALESQARVAELQQQVVALQQQLAQSQAERDQARGDVARWRGLYRAVRIKSIADATANEAIASDAGHDVAQVAATAAANAVGGLDDAALANDAWALHVARGWGIAAARSVPRRRR